MWASCNGKLAKCKKATSLLNTGSIDSLSAVDLVQKLGQAVGMELSSTLIFDYPTVDALALHLVQKAVPCKEPTTLVEEDFQIVGATTSRAAPYARLSIGARLPSKLEDLASPHLGSWDAISKVPLYRWDLDVPPVSSACQQAKKLRDIQMFKHTHRPEHRTPSRSSMVVGSMMFIVLIVCCLL
jgi:acyl carrier protein